MEIVKIVRDNHSCPLCTSDKLSLNNEFLECAECNLTFKKSECLLLPDKEKSRYALHNNSRSDLGYVNFLKPAVEAVSKYHEPGATGLDYGCGPVPVLAQLLSELGYKMHHYDPFFFKEHGIFGENAFDFITCTEAAEHFYCPGRDFAAMFANLRSRLFLMTETRQPSTDLRNWHYAKDPTHVTFYSESTLKWLASRYNCHLEIVNTRLAIFNRKN